MKSIFLDIFIAKKAISIAFASAENIIASTGSRAEKNILLDTAAAAAAMLYLNHQCEPQLQGVSNV